MMLLWRGNIIKSVLGKVNLKNAQMNVMVFDQLLSLLSILLLVAIGAWLIST